MVAMDMSMMMMMMAMMAMMAVAVGAVLALGVGYIFHLRNERNRAREALYNAHCQQAYMAGFAAVRYKPNFL